MLKKNKLISVLIFLTIIFIIEVSFLASLKFKHPTKYTKVFTSLNWKKNEKNALRIIFLEYLNKNSFLPFKIKLYLKTKNKKIKLLEKNIKNKFLNENIYLANIKSNKGILLGEIIYKNKIFDKFKLKLTLEDSYSSKKIKISKHIIKDDEKIIEVDRFKKFKIEGLKIQIFNFFKEHIFSAHNKIFILATNKNYEPYKFKTKINIKDFFSKVKELNLESDKNGLIEFSSYIYANDGFIKLKNDIENKEIPFYIKNQKTSISSKKLVYFNEKKINLNINSYKKIQNLYFSVYSGKQWIYTKKIKLNNKKANINFIAPDNFSGFLDFIVHRNYSYGDDLSSLKIFIGERKKLNDLLLGLKNKYIKNILSQETANILFYNFIISQLESDYKNPSLQFDSFKLQQEKINYYKNKYISILWYILIATSLLIIILVFIYGDKSIKKANEKIDYDFISKGKYLYLYMILSILSAFLFMILFVLKII